MNRTAWECKGVHWAIASVAGSLIAIAWLTLAPLHQEKTDPAPSRSQVESVEPAHVRTTPAEDFLVLLDTLDVDPVLSERTHSEEVGMLSFAEEEAQPPESPQPVTRPRQVAASRGTAPRTLPPAPPAATGQQTQTWIWPLTGSKEFSEFGKRDGRFHTGLDIAADSGTPVIAMKDGTVTFAGLDGGYGHCVILDHDGGIRTRYAHASTILVTPGQAVRQGEPIILVGSTGNSTGPHLHLEILVNGTPANPRLYLPPQ